MSASFPSAPAAGLRCPVRGCGLALDHLTARTCGCAAGHRFDYARSGYLNLIQPQDRRSLAAGDRADVVAARRRLALAGHLDWLLDGLAAIVARHAPRPSDHPLRILDIGCGDGAVLVGVGARLPGPHAAAVGHGVDLSVPAIEAAARTWPHAVWVVANADRGLPWQDGGFSVLLSITARLNGPEMARVLAADGIAVVAVPGADDLVELREEVMGRAELREDRLSRALATVTPYLAVRERLELRGVVELDAEARRDLMLGTYRGGRHSRQPQLDALGAGRTTMSRDLAVLVPSQPRRT